MQVSLDNSYFNKITHISHEVVYMKDQTIKLFSYCDVGCRQLFRTGRGLILAQGRECGRRFFSKSKRCKRANIQIIISTEGYVG